MAVKVRVPMPMRSLTNGAGEVAVAEGSLSAVIVQLERDYPGMGERLCDEGGELRRFVNVFVNGEDARFLNGLDTPVKDGDELSIIPAMAGG
jgi:molybdopterin synthase sulfur carrier subunit